MPGKRTAMKRGALMLERVQQLQVHAVGDDRRLIAAHVVIVDRLRRAHLADERNRIGIGRHLQRRQRLRQQSARPQRRRRILAQLGVAAGDETRR